MAKWADLTAECTRLRAEAANIAAQRDAAEKRATQAEERLRAVEAENEALRESHISQDLRWLKAMLRALDAEQKLALATGQRDRFLTMLRDTEAMRETAEAELARIRAADRTSITVRTTEAAKMRKGQAI